MASIPFLHPALLGVAVAVGIAWSALAPEKARGLLWTGLAAALGAAVAGLAGWVPWFGQLQITAYALLLLVGFGLAFWIARHRAQVAGIDPDHARIQLIIAAITGTLGARIWYVIEYRREFPGPFSDFPGWLAQAADLDRGGAVWFGALLCGGIAMVVHTRRAGIPLVTWADCVAPGVLAGLTLGRIGCFLNGCCYGATCNLPWGVSHLGRTVHPTQLYESVACAIFTVVVLRIAPGRGTAAGWALISYALWRILNETMRGDYDVKLGQGFSLSPLHLTSAQWFALLLLALGLWLVWRSRRGAPS
jgi:phosphatidylglycerol:prolipoprotein diacylglycerol transferase